MSETAQTLGTNARAAIAGALNQALADTTVATMLAQNFHWNVKGMAFGPLHTLFQTIYEDHFIGQDDLAERIRALSAHAEGNLAAMLKRTKVVESDGKGTAEEMVAALATAQETVAASLSACAAEAAEQGDTLTEDLCIARGHAHEKFAWMLRSHLG